jgi:acyl-CoA thioester hydrolase
MTAAFEYRPRVRFFEVDQQRVVYHMWYLAYFEDARNALLEDRGMSLRQLQVDGFDLQVVHYDIDWKAPIGWSDDLRIVLSDIACRNTSFTVGFEAWAGDAIGAAATAVYDVIDPLSGGARPVPAALRAVLEGIG